MVVGSSISYINTASSATIQLLHCSFPDHFSTSFLAITSHFQDKYLVHHHPINTMHFASTIVALASSLALVQGSFMSSCRNPQLLNSGLEAECRTASGGWHQSRLELNSCLANDDGHLNWRAK
jgi:hypothetical protein